MTSEIVERHKHRHDHGDTAPSCRSCNYYLSADSGHNRIVCGRCGTPNSYWVEP